MPFSRSCPRETRSGLPKGRFRRSFDIFLRRSRVSALVGRFSLCGRLRSEAVGASADAARLRLPLDCPWSDSSLGDRRQSVPSDCLLGLVLIFLGTLLTPVRVLDTPRFGSKRTEVSYMTSGEKSSSRLLRWPLRCHPALAWKSNLVASRRPVNHAPCTVLGWYRVVASPAKSMRGWPRLSDTGSARASYSAALRAGRVKNSRDEDGHKSV